MAVKIRLARHGRHKLPYYRVVVADSEMRRDGRYLELVGSLNPLTQPSTISLKEDRIKYWVGVGAIPTDTVAQMIEKKIPGYLKDIEKSRSEKIRSARAKRKARAKARAVANK
jgi:small subunit ribosomal protein S16